jgi:hypothetical protein
MALIWKKRPASVQAGEYVEATVFVVQTYSTDERFTITPCGSMSYKRDHGVHGALNLRWRWTGYRLRDLKGQPWHRGKFQTVTDAKREAERRVRERVDDRGVPLRWAGSMLGWMPEDAEYFTGENK